MTPAFIRSFRYTPDKGILYVMVGILVTAPILALIYAASIGQFQWGGAIAMLTFSLVYFYFCVVAFIDSSELVVNEDGLARRIFGRNCMQTPWTGIKLIRERFFSITVMAARFGSMFFLINYKGSHFNFGEPLSFPTSSRTSMN